MHRDKELRCPRLALWIMKFGFWGYVGGLVALFVWGLWIGEVKVAL